MIYLAIWRNEWDGEICINHGTSNSKGVMIGISRDLEYKVFKYDCDEEGRIQILSIIYKDTKFLLINIYNENTEPKQVSLITNLMLKLKNFGDVSDHNFIFGGDWNFIFDSKLDANGGSPTIKRKTFTELIKLSEKYDIADIFRVRHPEKKDSHLDRILQDYSAGSIFS